VNGLLVRVGADQAYGGWNAPVDPDSGQFVYVPIPEAEDAEFQAGMARSFQEMTPFLDEFCLQHDNSVQFPGAMPPQ
jgi:putative DNA base modification enzyme with NMAD domain